jgi:hypothetical protein
MFSYFLIYRPQLYFVDVESRLPDYIVLVTRVVSLACLAKVTIIIVFSTVADEFCICIGEVVERL